MPGLVKRSSKFGHGLAARSGRRSAAQRAAMLPNIVRVMLAAFLEDVAATDGQSG